MAQKLVTPVGFMYANEVLDQALKQDRTNERAQFLKAFIAPTLQLRGILKRIEPMTITETAAVQAELQELKNAIIVNSGLQAFLIDGQPNLHSEQELQTVVDGFRREQDRFRLFVKSHKTMSIDLEFNLVDSLTFNERKKMWKTCTVNSPTQGVYLISACDFISRQSAQMEQADLEIIQQAATGAEIYTILATSYDATGLYRINKTIRKGYKLTEKQILTFLRSDAHFGQLRASHSLADIKAMGADLLTGARWAQRLQASLCPTQAPSSNDNRPGMVFEKGICLIDGTGRRPVKVENVLKVLDMALSGQSIEIYSNKQKLHATDISGPAPVNAMVTKVRPMALVQNPVADLKALLPQQFDSCDRAVGVGEETLGNTFQNADATRFLKSLGSFNSNCH